MVRGKVVNAACDSVWSRKNENKVSKEFEEFDLNDSCVRHDTLTTVNKQKIYPQNSGNLKEILDNAIFEGVWFEISEKICVNDAIGEVESLISSWSVLNSCFGFVVTGSFAVVGTLVLFPVGRS